MKSVYHEFPRQNFVEVKFLRNAPKAHSNAFYEDAAQAFAQRNAQMLELFAPQALAPLPAPPEPRSALAEDCEAEDVRVFSAKLAQMAQNAADFERKLAEVQQRRASMSPEELWPLLNSSTDQHVHPLFNPQSAFRGNRAPPDLIALSGEFADEAPPDDARLLPL